MDENHKNGTTPDGNGFEWPNPKEKEKKKPCQDNDGFKWWSSEDKKEKKSYSGYVILVVVIIIIMGWLIFGKTKPPPFLVAVPAGEYTVPSHLKRFFGDFGTSSIVIKKTYFIQKGEVTVGEFKQYVNSLEDKKKDNLISLWKQDFNGKPAPDSQPVEYISLNEANNYALWLTQKTGWEMRTPTLKEWAAAVILYAETVPVLAGKYDFPMQELRKETDHLLGNLREWSSEKCMDGKHYLLGEDYMTKKEAVGKPLCVKNDLIGKGVGFRLVTLGRK